MRRILVSVAVAGLVIAAAVAFAVLVLDDGDDGGQAGPAASSTTTDPPTTTTTRSRRGSGEPVTFVFGGDVHFEGSLKSRLNANPAGLLSPIAGELSAADVAVVNLETAITEGGTPAPKEYNFRAPARAFEALAAAGVDVATLANNHGMDYGTAGLADTLAAKAATPIGVVGVGANAGEAYAPWRADVKGQRIAVFGVTDVLDDSVRAQWTATDTQGGLASSKVPEQERFLAAIRAERPNADTIVVYLHWGAEGDTCPTTRQQELALALVDAGADIIVGSHSHRVQTAGRMGSALVAYGLGNFVFYNESGQSGVTGVLTVTATGRDVDTYAWKPARIRGGVPTLVGDPTAAQDRAAFDARRASCTTLTP